MFVAGASKELELGAAIQFGVEEANVTVAFRNTHNHVAMPNETDCDEDTVFSVEVGLADRNGDELQIAALIRGSTELIL